LVPLVVSCLQVKLVEPLLLVLLGVVLLAAGAASVLQLLVMTLLFLLRLIGVLETPLGLRLLLASVPCFLLQL
jgi:hypothetical protein